MDWVKLATNYYRDPKVRSLPDADTEVLFIRGLAYAGDQETGGFIPEAALPMLTRRRRYAGCVDALTASGLWTQVPGGYRMPAWSDWQDALDVLANRRAADRERKRDRRRQARESLVRRYGDRCRRCGTDENLVIDHILPISRGGTDTDDNKQLLCWSCNAHKRNLTEEEYEAWVAETGALPSPTPPTKRNAGVSLSADISPDVHPLEGEGEEELPKGGTTTHDPPDQPPPRRCPIHASLAGPAPPCGLCADARRTHTAWLTQHSNGSSPVPPHPLDGQQAAGLAAASRHMQGITCMSCSNTGWTLDGDGFAIPCRHQP